MRSDGIVWGKRTRVVLDVRCSVANFGGYLFDGGVVTMSLASKDEHEAQVQMALKRSIPAISAVMGSMLLVNQALSDDSDDDAEAGARGSPPPLPCPPVHSDHDGAEADEEVHLRRCVLTGSDNFGASSSSARFPSRSASSSKNVLRLLSPFLVFVFMPKMDCNMLCS
ncbi:hypothetical protein ACQ4PT_039444 [Festuca glaucescens]